MPIRNWKHHLPRLVAGLVPAIGLGWFTGYPALLPAIFLLLYVAWQSYNSIGGLHRLNDERQQQYQSVIDDFHAMTEALPDATVVLDNHDVITWSNNSAVQLLGLETGGVHGQIITHLVQEHGFADWLAIQDRAPGKLEISCPVDASITLQLSATRFRENQRLLILRDITDIQNMDRMRRDFLANASHELRTPLTVLLGYLEILRYQPEQSDRKAVKRMFKQARKMHALLEDLLELSRLQDAEISNNDTEIDIPAMLVQLKEQAEDYSKGTHELHFDIQAGLNLAGVESDIHSAFQNLLNNAINYTPAGGHIEVSWRELNDNLVFTVKDSGVGIPQKDIPRLTERFYRVGSDRARQSGGTGLGLAIVKHVLNSHQAMLDIESEPGKGSEFRCSFPIERMT